MKSHAKDREPRPRRVLIVDDHPLMRRGITQLIDLEPDFEVCGDSGDPLEALEAIREKNPDIVIADVSLRDRDLLGIDLVKDIRVRHGRLPVLMLSMHDESLYAERALRALDNRHARHPVATARPPFFRQSPYHH